MYRTYLKSSLSTFDLINKNKYLPDGVKYCNGCCQDIRNLEEFSKVNKDGYCSVCRKCTNTIQLAKKKIKNGEFTVEEFKNDYTIMDDKTTDIDNELTLTCSSCKEDKSATQFDSAKRQCKACKSLSAIERNNKDMDIIYRDIDKLKFDHMIELKRYITQIPKDKLVKVISHYKIGRKSSDTKDRMIFNITEHFQLLSNPYKCAGKCGVTLTTQSTTCENCKRITKKEKVILSMVYFEDNVLPTITETLISKIDETTKWTYNKKQLIMIAHAFKLRPANKADRETIIEMINNKIDKINETKKREEAIEIIENKTEKLLKEAKSVDISGVGISIHCENNVENVENVEIVNMKKNNILTLNDIEIIARKSDGFINATQMCKAGGKQFKHWKENKHSEQFIKILSSSVGIPTDKIIKYENGSNNERSTWCYPRVAINIAQWISAEFDVKVTGWIQELLTTGSVTLNQEKTAKELDEIWKSRLIDIENSSISAIHKFNDHVLEYRNNTKSALVEIIDTLSKLFNETNDNWSGQNVLYFAYIGEIDGKCVFKYGESSNFAGRQKAHNNNFSKFNLIIVRQCYNSLVAETEFKKFIYEKNRKFTSKYDNKVYDELCYAETKEELLEMRQKIIEISNNNCITTIKNSVNELDKLKLEKITELFSNGKLTFEQYEKLLLNLK